MKIYLATDHTGFQLKESIKQFLTAQGHEVEDCGAYVYNKDDDYPDFVSKAAAGVSKDPDNTCGIIFGGTGEAEMMTANKYYGVRCALFYAKAVPVETVDVSGRMSTDPFEVIRLTREHNNANMLSLAARFLTEDDIKKAIILWLTTAFPAEERHVRRIGKIKDIESRIMNQESGI